MGVPVEVQVTQESPRVPLDLPEVRCPHQVLLRPQVPYVREVVALVVQETRDLQDPCAAEGPGLPDVHHHGVPVDVPVPTPPLSSPSVGKLSPSTPGHRGLLLRRPVDTSTRHSSVDGSTRRPDVHPGVEGVSS